jgi:hypothetical protein
MSGEYFLPFNVTKRLQTIVNGRPEGVFSNTQRDQLNPYPNGDLNVFGNYRFTDGILAEGVVPTYLNKIGVNNLFFRTGQAVKDLLLPVEDFYGLKQNDSQLNTKKVPSCKNEEYNPNQADEYRTTNPIYRDCAVRNSRICFSVDMKAEGLSLDSFRIYLLRTGYPKNYAANYCAWKEFNLSINGSAEGIVYPFLNPDEEETQYYSTDVNNNNYFESYSTIPGSANEYYSVFPTTETLNGILNFPLFGGAYSTFRNNLTSSWGYTAFADRIGKSYNVEEYTNTMFRPDPKMHTISITDSRLSPNPVDKYQMGAFAQGIGYVNLYDRDGVNTYGRSGVGLDNIHALRAGTSNGYNVVTYFNGSFATSNNTNYPFYLNPDFINRIFNYGNDKHGDNVSLPQFRNNYSYFPFRFSSAHTNIRKFFDSYYLGLTSDLYQYFQSAIVNVPNYSGIIKTNLSGTINAQEGRNLPLGVPIGYYNLGYNIEPISITTGNPLNLNLGGITFIEKHLIPGITKDAKNSYYKRLSHISQRFANKFKILNDNSSVKNYLSQYYPDIADVTGSGILVNAGHPLLQAGNINSFDNIGNIDNQNPYIPSYHDTISTRQDAIIFDSGAIYYNKATDTHKFLSDDLTQIGNYANTPNDPFNVSGSTSKTKQYISKAISNPLKYRDGTAGIPKGVVKYKGNGVYNFCITIPDILDYVADGGAFENGLRLVVYTDVMATDNQFTQKADVSLANFGLNFGKAGSGCNFESVNVSDPNDLNCFDCSAGGVFTGCYLVAFRSKGGDCNGIFSSSTTGSGTGIDISGGSVPGSQNCGQVCRTPDDFYSAFIMCDAVDAADTDCQCKVSGLDVFSNQECDALIVNNSWSFNSVQPPISARADKFASQQFFRNNPTGSLGPTGEKDPYNRGFRFGLDGIQGTNTACETNDGYPPYRWWTQGLTSDLSFGNPDLGGLRASIEYAERVLPAMPEGTTYDPYTHAFIIPILEDVDYSGIFNLGEVLDVIGNVDKVKGIVAPAEGEGCPAKPGVDSSSYDCNHACIGGPYYSNPNYSLLNPYATFGSNYQKMSCSSIMQDPYRYLAISDLYTVLSGQSEFVVPCSAAFNGIYPRQGLYGQVNGVFNLPSGDDIKYIKTRALDEPCGTQLIGLRKLYVDETNYICVDMDISDPVIRNNFEPCGNEEA